MSSQNDSVGKTFRIKHEKILDVTTQFFQTQPVETSVGLSGEF